MKFILTFTGAGPVAGKRDESAARFKKTGGRPPEGVKLLGRWTRADMSGGWCLLETDDLKALAEFAQAWNDLMHIEIAPVLEDAELADVQGRLGQ